MAAAPPAATDVLKGILLATGDSSLAHAQQLRAADPTTSRLEQLQGGLWLCLALCLARALYNCVFDQLVRKQKRGYLHNISKQAPEELDKIEEKLWTVTGSSVLVVLSWKCMAAISQTCSLADPASCMVGWPLVPLGPRSAAYYNVELGWYLHLMLKHVLGLGLNDGGAMCAHHAATVALIVLSYCLNTHNIGIMVLACLNLSSPLLHLAKLANMMQLKRARVLAFMAFAIVFFVSRICVFPYVVVRGAMVGAAQQVPQIFMYRSFFMYYAVQNVLLVSLAALQWVWLVPIVKIAREALTGTDEGLTQRAGAHDHAEGRVPVKSGETLQALRRALSDKGAAQQLVAVAATTGGHK